MPSPTLKTLPPRRRRRERVEEQLRGVAARVWSARRAITWRRSALVIAIVVVLLPIAGLVYEAYADGMAAREFPAPGMFVDVGGRRLHVVCIGNGSPTVLFEPSGWGNALSAPRARERIASRATVCSYDRSGLGWSDPASGAMSTADLVNDLAVLQDRAPLQGPYLIVASSIGGLTAELFARQFPERVAGLVFLDAANSFTLPLRERFGTWLQPAACASGVLAHFGAIRLLDPFELSAETSEEGRRSAAMTYSSRPWMQLCRMARGLDETLAAFASAPALRPDLPITVLTAERAQELMPPPVRDFVNVQELQRELRESHQKLASLSTRGTWAVVPDSDHLIASSQPDAVVDAVFEMLDAR